MIEYLKGEITELQPALAVVECGGVGYGLNISLTTYSAIQGKERAKLYVSEVIREDAHLLWGFATKSEREQFLLLNSVSGIGAATSRMVLSAFSPSELVGIISRGDERLLKSIKGIGPKAAQRIIVELKDKVLSLDVAAGGAASTAAAPATFSKEVQDEAVSALTMLGFPPAPSQKAVVALLTQEPELRVEDVIKKALKML